MEHQYGASTGLQIKVNKQSRLTVLDQEQPKINNLKKLRDIANMDTEETFSKKPDLVKLCFKMGQNVFPTK